MKYRVPRSLILGFQIISIFLGVGRLGFAALLSVRFVTIIQKSDNEDVALMRFCKGGGYEAYTVVLRNSVTGAVVLDCLRNSEEGGHPLKRLPEQPSHHVTSSQANCVDESTAVLTEAKL